MELVLEYLFWTVHSGHRVTFAVTKSTTRGDVVQPHNIFSSIPDQSHNSCPNIDKSTRHNIQDVSITEYSRPAGRQCTVLLHDLAKLGECYMEHCRLSRSESNGSGY